MLATDRDNPFPGLRPFEAGHEHLFFGRDAVLAELLAQLNAHRFVAVLGAAGIGKSSLVRARMLPALYRRFANGAGLTWRVALMRPGNAPLASLAYALMHPHVLGSDFGNRELKAWIAREVLDRGPHGLVELVEQSRLDPGTAVLIVVDQFDELFRYAHCSSAVAPRDEAEAFVKLVLEATSQSAHPIFAVLTIGSDYLDRSVRFRNLPEAINLAHVLVPGMTRAELQRAIEAPARIAGAAVEPALTKCFVDEFGDDPGDLPALQHALMRAWHVWRAEGRADEPVGLRHLKAAGGSAHALSRHLDETYAELPDDRSREIAAKLFKALTGVGPDNVAVRRPTCFADAWAIIGCTSDELRRVVEPFRAPGRSFLRPATRELDETSVLDLSYERLMRP